MKMNMFVIMDKIVWMFFIKKMDEFLSNFVTFPRQKMISIIHDEKRKHNAATVGYLCSE